MSSIRDAVVIVTGGGNGLGRDYCRALARSGARVVVADLDGPAAEEAAAELEDGGGRALACTVDVTSEADTQRLVAQAVERFGTVDVLVNNAGSYPHVPFREIDHEAWRRIMAVNLDSVFLCTRAVVPAMTEQGSGRIINVATNLVWTGLANMAHYIAAKSGVVGLTRALARELGPDGIRVNAIAPGAVIPEGRLTALGQDSAQEIVANQCIPRPQQPTDLVGAMLFLCSAASDFVSGQVLTVDGGLTMH